MTSDLLQWGYLDVETPAQGIRRGRHIHTKTAIVSQEARHQARHGTPLPSRPSEETTLHHFDLGLVATRAVRE